MTYIKKKIIRPTFTILKYETNNSVNVSNKSTIDKTKSTMVSPIVENSVENVENNTPQEEYKFELVSYGYVSDTIIYTNKEKAIRFYLFNNGSFDFIIRLYINGERIPNEKIKSVLGITRQIEYDYNKSISRSYI